MKMVIGVVRTTCLQRLVKELEAIDIRNITIIESKGIGEQVTLFEVYAIHKMVVIVVQDGMADVVADTILQSARSGSAGDGIVAVCPVDYVVKIRTAERSE